jgi:diguanylate cyclase (GGDEF)-like protein/PAS domain S-box-containing protein
VDGTPSSAPPDPSGLPDPQLLGVAAVLSASTAALVLIDLSRRIWLTNQVFADLIGSAPDRLAGRNVWEILPAEIGIAATLDWQAGDRRLVLPKVPEQVCTNAVGDRRRVAWSLGLVRDPAGGVVGLLATGVDVTRERLAEANWREQAHTDALTGLHNRASIVTALVSVLDVARGVGCALIYGDLDDFKQVNDTYGHAVGDHVLIEVATRLRATVREDDLVARLGGDEFLIVAPACGYFAARAIAARTEKAMGRPIHVPDLSAPIYASMSLGIQVADPDQDVAGALQAADAAMYKQKRAKRQRGHFAATR